MMLVRCLFIRYGAKEIEVNIFRQLIQSGKGRFMQWRCVGCLWWDLTVFTQIMRRGPLLQRQQGLRGGNILRLAVLPYSPWSLGSGKCLLMK